MLKSFLTGLTIGGIGTLLAMQYHLVRTNERFVIVSRLHQPPLRSSYVDIRHWSPAMWEHYPELQEAIVKAGREDLLLEQQAKALSPDKDKSMQLRDVSQPLKTLIRNTTEARLPKPVLQEATAESIPAESSLSIPHSAIASAKPDQNLTTSPETLLHALPSLQRPVPCPVEMKQETEIATIDESVQEVIPEANKSGWVQSLIRTIVPGAESLKSVKLPEVISESLESNSLQEEVLPAQEEMSFPASPRRIADPSVKSI